MWSTFFGTTEKLEKMDIEESTIDKKDYLVLGIECDWKCLSYNIGITMDILLQNKDKLDYSNHLALNTSVPLEFIEMTIEDKPWNLNYLLLRDDITYAFIMKYKHKEWDFTKSSGRDKFTLDEMFQCPPEFVFNWHNQIDKHGVDMILGRVPSDFRSVSFWNEMSCYSHLSITQHVLPRPSLPWNWEYLTENTHQQERDRHPSLPWIVEVKEKIIMSPKPIIDYDQDSIEYLRSIKQTQFPHCGDYYWRCYWTDLTVKFSKEAPELIIQNDDLPWVYTAEQVFFTWELFNACKKIPFPEWKYNTLEELGDVVEWLKKQIEFGREHLDWSRLSMKPELAEYMLETPQLPWKYNIAMKLNENIFKAMAKNKK